MTIEATARLDGIARRIEEIAARLRAEDVDGEEARALAGECAELAAEAAVELDRLARGGAQDTAPGQEELL